MGSMCQLNPLLGVLLDLKPFSASLPSSVSLFSYYCCQSQVILINVLHTNAFHTPRPREPNLRHSTCCGNDDRGYHLTVALPDGVTQCRYGREPFQFCGSTVGDGMSVQRKMSANPSFVENGQCSARSPEPISAESFCLKPGLQFRLKLCWINSTWVSEEEHSSVPITMSPAG